MTISQPELPVDQDLSDQQAQLDKHVRELFYLRKVYDCDGQPYAYEEFVRFDDKDKHQDEVIRFVYVALTNSGIKIEGEMYPSQDPDSISAINGYVMMLDKFLGGCRNVRWRHRPEIECHEPGKWTIYSRLVCYT
jgi:hypothetical protein